MLTFSEVISANMLIENDHFEFKYPDIYVNKKISKFSLFLFIFR